MNWFFISGRQDCQDSSQEWHHLEGRGYQARLPDRRAVRRVGSARGDAGT